MRKPSWSAAADGAESRIGRAEPASGAESALRELPVSGPDAAVPEDVAAGAARPVRDAERHLPGAAARRRQPVLAQPQPALEAREAASLARRPQEPARRAGLRKPRRAASQDARQASARPGASTSEIRALGEERALRPGQPASPQGAAQQQRRRHPREPWGQRQRAVRQARRLRLSSARVWRRVRA